MNVFCGKNLSGGSKPFVQMCCALGKRCLFIRNLLNLLPETKDCRQHVFENFSCMQITIWTHTHTHKHNGMLTNFYFLAAGVLLNYGTLIKLWHPSRLKGPVKQRNTLLHLQNCSRSTPHLSWRIERQQERCQAVCSLPRLHLTHYDGDSRVENDDWHSALLYLLKPRRKYPLRDVIY